MAENATNNQMAVSPPETAEASAVSSHAATQLTNLKAPDTQDGAQEPTKVTASSGMATGEALPASVQKEIEAIAAAFFAIKAERYEEIKERVDYLADLAGVPEQHVAVRSHVPTLDQLARVDQQIDNIALRLNMPELCHRLPYDDIDVRLDEIDDRIDELLDRIV
jgi:hypothetical protein